MTELSTVQRTYKVWAADDVVYGPIDFPLLSQWAREARVTRENWIFTEQTESWSRAADLPELGLFFQQADKLVEPGTISDPLIPGVPVGTLQSVEIFKDMTDQQRGRFAQCMEVQKFEKFEVIVNEGDPGSGALYIILEGNVRVRKMIGGKENILTTSPTSSRMGITARHFTCEKYSMKPSTKPDRSLASSVNPTFSQLA